MKKYKIFGADGIDTATLKQFQEALAFEDAVYGALMPDGHFGYTMPIGGVIGTKKTLLPSWVGYDIGCGVYGVKTTYRFEDVIEYGKEIYDNIKRSIPMGFDHRKQPMDWHSYTVLPKSDWFDAMYHERKGNNQLGTLGGGNHFIEIGVSDKDQFVWIIIHSGSRGIGHKTATHYIKKAHPEGKCKEGSYGFDANSKIGAEYCKDMTLCLRFAYFNRIKIAEEVNAAIKESVNDGNMVIHSVINCNHNLASWDSHEDLWIHRKGATVATKNTLGIVPGNMRDGSFIVAGLGNVESLYSCSHGAGRVMSRSEAKRTVKLEDFKTAMDGIIAGREESLLDEAPSAYKSISAVMQAQKELVEVVEYIKPIINVKAGE